MRHEFLNKAKYKCKGLEIQVCLLYSSKIEEVTENKAIELALGSSVHAGL
jgi:hypothetical protein